MREALTTTTTTAANGDDNNNNNHNNNNTHDEQQHCSYRCLPLAIQVHSCKATPVVAHDDSIGVQDRYDVDNEELHEGKQ
jgi:hypothetical protein